MNFGGGFIPSCSINESLSATPQCSTSFPSLNFIISITVISNFLPVGGIGPNCFSCVPRPVMRPHTVSLSTTRSSIISEKSGKAPCRFFMPFLTPSALGGENPCWCSMKAGEEWVSNTVTSPLLNPSSIRILKSCSFVILIRNNERLRSTQQIVPLAKPTL